MMVEVQSLEVEIWSWIVAFLSCGLVLCIVIPIHRVASGKEFGGAEEERKSRLPLRRKDSSLLLHYIILI